MCKRSRRATDNKSVVKTGAEVLTTTSSASSGVFPFVVGHEFICSPSIDCLILELTVFVDAQTKKVKNEQGEQIWFETPSGRRCTESNPTKLGIWLCGLRLGNW